MTSGHYCSAAYPHDAVCWSAVCYFVVYIYHIHFLLVFSSHIIAMVSHFQAVGNTKLIFILVKEIVLYTGISPLLRPL